MKWYFQFFKIQIHGLGRTWNVIVDILCLNYFTRIIVIRRQSIRPTANRKRHVSSIRASNFSRELKHLDDICEINYYLPQYAK